VIQVGVDFKPNLPAQWQEPRYVCFIAYSVPVLPRAGRSVAAA
jgi:hypothetical protein